MQDNFVGKLIRCISPSVAAIITALIAQSVISDWRTEKAIQEKVTVLEVEMKHFKADVKRLEARIDKIEN